MDVAFLIHVGQMYPCTEFGEITDDPFQRAGLVLLQKCVGH